MSVASIEGEEVVVVVEENPPKFIYTENLELQ